MLAKTSLACLLLLACLNASAAAPDGIKWIPGGSFGMGSELPGSRHPHDGRESPTYVEALAGKSGKIALAGILMETLKEGKTIYPAAKTKPKSTLPPP